VKLRAVARWLGVVAAAIGALAIAWAVAPLVPISALAGYVIAFAAVTASVLATAWAAPADLPLEALAWLAVPAGALAGVAMAGEASLAPWGAAVVTGAVLCSGTLAGAVIGGRIEHAGHLVVVAIVSSLADVYSVLHPSGPSAAIVESPTLLPILTLPWPILGTDGIGPILGVGDVALAALYVAAARRHGLSMRKTILVLAIGLALTAALVIVTERPIPALPLLGAAFVVAHPEARKVPIKDRRVAIVGVLALAIAMGAAWLAWGR